MEWTQDCRTQSDRVGGTKEDRLFSSSSLQKVCLAS